MSEHDEAVVLCQWMDARGIMYFHTPNEGKRSFNTARRLKAEGMQPGFPDYTILSWAKPPRVCRPPVFLELKSTTGKLSEKQAEWIEWLSGAGYPCRCCIGADQAIEWLQSLGY